MAPLQTWTVDKPYLNIHCGLGEGPYYEKATNVLRFVDIKKKRVHFVNLDQGPESLRTLQLDVPVGVTADVEGVDPADKILVGLKYGIAVLDVRSGAYEYVAKLHDRHNERLRSNDGAVDPNGRFWLGTMTDFGLGDFQVEGMLRIFSHSAGFVSLSQSSMTWHEPLSLKTHDTASLTHLTAPPVVMTTQTSSPQAHSRRTNMHQGKKKPPL